MSKFDDTRMFDTGVLVLNVPVAILSILAAGEYYTIQRIGISFAAAGAASQIDVVQGTAPAALTGTLWSGFQITTTGGPQLIADYGPEGFDLHNAEGLFFRSNQSGDGARGWILFRVNNGVSPAP